MKPVTSPFFSSVIDDVLLQQIAETFGVKPSGTISSGLASIKKMKIDPYFQGQPVAIQTVSRRKSEKEQLPELRSDQIEELSLWWRQMWAKPEQWHRLAKSKLSGRAGRSRKSGQTIEFEIRNQEALSEEYIYVYNGWCHELSRMNTEYEEEGNVEKKCQETKSPGNEKEKVEKKCQETRSPGWEDWQVNNLARAIVALMYKRPELASMALMIDDNREISAIHKSSATSVVGSKLHVISGLWQRITEQWFIKKDKKRPWHWTFCIAFLGSSSLFFPLVYMGWTEIEKWIQAVSELPNAFLEIETIWGWFSVALVAIPSWFAYLGTIGTGRYGPVRVYISTFLLTYFIAQLIKFMI